MAKKTLSSASGKFYMNNGKFGDDLLLENQIARKKEQDLVEEANKLYLEASQKKQEEINRKLETLEILPMTNKVILSMYPENPYRKVLEGIIIVDYDGSFMNPDTGEKDKLKQLVACAKVIEVGPEVKYVKPGDDVYFDPRTCYPVPFMSLGYLLTSEPAIHCVLNEGLKTRFNMS
jgi:hypothetical protein